jgi:hypothetical protein
MVIKSQAIRNMLGFNTLTPPTILVAEKPRQNTRISFAEMEFHFVVLTGDMGSMKTD